MQTLIKQLTTLLRPTVEALGYELWGLVYHGKTLSVFVEGSEGITIEGCEKVSRQISSVLDAESPIRSAYILEVSSPGIDRLLFELGHYQKYVGKEIKVKLFEPMNGRRAFAGKIVAVSEDEMIKLEVDGETHQFPLSKIQTAQVVFQSTKQEKKKLK